MFAVKYNGSTYFYRKDAQANVVALLDNNGTVVVRYKYDAWGECKVLNASGVEITGNSHIGILNPFRYRSYYYDTETGFYFLKTRYYDPEIGRFMTIDDLSYLDPDSINGLNLYAYCGDNPMMRVDAIGCDWWNPFTWNLNGLFNSIGNAISGAGQWISNNILNPVGTFFVNNLDIIVGIGLVIGAVVTGIATFGATTIIAGIIAGAVFGGAFGALNAVANGGNVLQGALTGMFVGALGGISGWAAFLGAAGMSIINDRINGKEAGFDTLLRAGISGLTAGIFAGACNGLTTFVTKNTSELFVKSFCAVLYGFFFSSYNFVADVIINCLPNNL